MYSLGNISITLILYLIPHIYKAFVKRMANPLRNTPRGGEN